MRKYIAPLMLALVGFIFGGPFGTIVLLLIWFAFMNLRTHQGTKK